MNAAFVFCNQRLSVYLKGELDHHAAGEIRSRIDGEIIRREPKILSLDFSGVSFMDSSGLGLIMGRYRLMNERDGSVVIENPPPHIKKVLMIAGIGRLVKIVRTKENELTSKNTAKEEKEDETCKGETSESDANPLSGALTE